ncbi:MAG: DUF748 domain-containing protein [Planctomycetota bacterium]|nr:DUF748 domain-containing protein [Planctomycetota bacterium]
MEKTIENMPMEPVPFPPTAQRLPTASLSSAGKGEPSTAPKPPAGKRRSWWRVAGIAFVVTVGLLACIRPLLPSAVRWYVNRTLSRNLQYDGRIGDVTLNLWRGAYSISDIRLIKKSGNVPTPLFTAERLELAVQWDGILHRKMVGRVVMEHPELNFVDASDDSESQTGEGGPWLETLADLFPFKLNSVEIHNGAIHFRSYKKQKPVDVYLSGMEASVDDLTNIRDRSTPMLTTVQASGLAMDQARFEFRMKMNPFTYRPTFKMATRLIGLDVTKTNDLARTYGQFEFKRGWFDLVVEVDASEGQMRGYVKPLFRNLKVFDLVDDVKNDDNPLQFFWQALLGVTTDLLKNHSRDQFGTSIPFTGDLSGPDTDILSTIGNVLRNGFVRAYLPRLENGTEGFDGMQFGPASMTDPISVGDQQ